MMNPLVLSFLCALGALGLIAYSVLDKDNILFGARQPNDKPIPDPIMKPPANDIIVEELEQRISSLAAEKEKFTLERRSLEAQLESAKKIETDSKAELEKEILKSGELNSKTAALEAQVNEYKLALKTQAGAVEELKSKLQAAVEKENALNQNIEAQKSALAEKEAALKKLSEIPVQQAGIPPEEYNRLKEKLEQAEEVLRILHAADK